MTLEKVLAGTVSLLGEFLRSASLVELWYTALSGFKDRIYTSSLSTVALLNPINWNKSPMQFKWG